VPAFTFCFTNHFQNNTHAGDRSNLSHGISSLPLLLLQLAHIGHRPEHLVPHQEIFGVILGILGVVGILVVVVVMTCNMQRAIQRKT